jgi:hypothetical protein
MGRRIFVALLPLFLLCQGAAAQTAAPFGAQEVPQDSGGIRHEWKTIYPTVRQDMQSPEMIAFASRFKGLPAPKLVRAVHAEVNKLLRHMPDLERWGVQERWSSPLETLRSKKADCEDYMMFMWAVIKIADPDIDVRMIAGQGLTKETQGWHGVVMALLENEKNHINEWIAFDSSSPPNGNKKLEAYGVAFEITDTELRKRFLPGYRMDERGTHFLFLPPNEASLR